MTLPFLVDPAVRILLDSAAKATALLILAGLAAWGMRRSSAAMRHRVWSLTMLGLLLLPVLSWRLPAWQLPILPATETAELLPTETPVIEPAAEVIASSPAPVLETESQPWTETASESFSPPSSALVDPVTTDLLAPAAAAPIPWWPIGTLMLWLLGVAVSVLGVIFGLWQARRFSTGSHVLHDEPWPRLVDELRDRLGLHRRVELREYSQPIVPLTWGLFRPMVLLPQQARDWADRMRRAVLLHELAHVQRGDVAYQLLGRIACALYWYHPLAWYALRQMRQEREHACDDAVVHSGERASDYAEQLLAVARLYHRPRGLSLAVEMTRGGSLEQRLRALFDAARSHRPLGRRTAFAVFVVASFLLGAVAVVKPVEQIQGTDSGKQTFVVVEWSALVDAGILKEIRTLSPKEARGGNESGAETIRCSAETLRAILKPHLGNKRRIIPGSHIGVITPTPEAFRKTGIARSFVDTENSQEDPPIFANWSGQGFAFLEDQHDAANLRLDMKCSLSVEVTSNLQSKGSVDFDETLRDGNAASFIIEAKPNETSWSGLIITYEALQIPSDQLDLFKLTAPTADWVQLGSGGFKRRIARAADWRQRDSVDVHEVDSLWTREMPNGGHAQLVAVARPKSVPFIWWTPDGKPFSWDHANIASNYLDLWNLDLVAVVRVWENGATRNQLGPGSSRSQFNIYEFPDACQEAPGSQLAIVPAQFSGKEGQGRLVIGAGFGGWTSETTIASEKNATATLNGIDIKFATIHNFRDHISAAFFWTPTSESEITAVALTKAGKSVHPTSNPAIYANEPPNTKNFGKTFDYSIKADEVDHFIIKSRPCRWVEFAGFATEPNEPLDPPHNFDQPDDGQPEQTEQDGDLRSENRRGRETRAEPRGRETRAKQAEHPIPVGIVIAQHVMLWEGKEIVTWDDIETKMAAYPDPSLLQPGFHFTATGLKWDQDRSASQQMARLKERFGYYGYSYGSISPRSGLRYDRIQKPEDLKVDETNRIEGRVLNAEGKPVADAEVVLVTPIPKEISYQTHDLHLLDGQVRNPLEEVLARTDLQGRFQLYPPAGENYLLIAVHPEAGFSLTRRDQFAESSDLTLSDWAEVQCDLKEHPGEPENQFVSLNSRLPAADALPELSLSLNSGVERDEDSPGLFRFAHVPPDFRTSLSRGFPDKETHASYHVPETRLFLTEGEVRKLELGPLTKEQRQQLDAIRRLAQERESGDLRSENRRGRETRAEQAANPNAERIEEILQGFRDLNHTVDQTETWCELMQELVDFGPEAVPQICKELDETNENRMLRRLGFALRAIGDPRAVPALIRAIPKALVPACSDYGLTVDDPELARFMQLHDLQPGIGKEGSSGFDFGRPMREVFGALHKLTGQNFGAAELNFMHMSEDPRRQVLQRRLYQRFAQQWADWWQEHAQEFTKAPAYAKANLKPLEEEELPTAAEGLSTEARIVSRTGGAVLSPAIEKGPYSKHFLDLDTGYQPTWPKDIPKDESKFDGQKLAAWAEENGVDLMCITQKSPDGKPIYVLRSFGLHTWEIDKADEKSILKRIEAETIFDKPVEGNLLMHYDAEKKEHVPDANAAFVYLTRDGSWGVIEITDRVVETRDITGLADAPKGVGFHLGVRFNSSAIIP